MNSTRRGFLSAMSAAANSNADQSSNDPQHQHEHQTVPSDMTLRVKALESLLIEKGLVDPAALDALVDTYENKVGPRNGAQVVARAWVDPDVQEASAERRAQGDRRIRLPGHARRSHGGCGEQSEST